MLFNISYTLSIDAGEQYGEEAALYWAQKQVDNRDKWYSPIYAVPGLFASLWTPCTSDATLATLTAAYGAGKYVGRPYYQYYPAENPAYSSKFITRGKGWEPPYSVGQEAADKLSLPKYNPGTAVREVNPKWWEPVRGPRTVKPANGRPGGGTEYYRGGAWQK